MSGHNGAYELPDDGEYESDEGEEDPYSEDEDEEDVGDEEESEDGSNDEEENEEDIEEEDEAGEAPNEAEFTAQAHTSVPDGRPGALPPGVTVTTETRTRARYYETRARGPRVPGPQIGVRVRGSYIERRVARAPAGRHLAELNPSRGPAALALLLQIEELYKERGLLEPLNPPKEVPV